MEKKLDEVELREDVEENHCKENQTRNTPRHGERLSPDHGDMQGVKPQDRRDQKQREEKQTLEEKEGFSHQQQIRAAGSGVFVYVCSGCGSTACVLCNYLEFIQHFLKPKFKNHSLQLL